MTQPQYDDYQPRDRDEWRAWLVANHASAPGVWLVTYKKASGKPMLPYAAAVEEALCVGWIDSRGNKLDDERTKLLFTPRQPGSPWSAPNKRRVAALIAADRMLPAGAAKIEAAKRDGAWTALDTVEALAVPSDLADALQANPAAAATFDAFSPSATKPLLWWIVSAKRPATRASRIARIVEAAAAGRNPLAWRPKQERGDG